MTLFSGTPGRLLRSSGRDPLAGAKSEKVLVDARIEGVAQGAVIVVLEGDEAEGLQNSVLEFARRLQDLRHGFHRARFRFDGDLDQIALFQGPGQSQHAASLGNGLQFGSRAAPVIQLDDDSDCAAELNSLRAVLRMSLGEVCHARTTMPWRRKARQITEALVRIPSVSLRRRPTELPKQQLDRRCRLTTRRNYLPANRPKPLVRLG